MWITRHAGHVALLVSATFAIQAGETGLPGGAGTSGISGYSVSKIEYELDPRDATISSVSFALEPEPAEFTRVSAEIAGIRYQCTVTLPRTVCTSASGRAQLAEAQTLTVIAAN